MKLIVAIGAGSFIGGILRYGLVVWTGQKPSGDFPIGTLMVNLIGCLLIGIIYGFSNNWNISPEWRLVITTGFLGGFTTFSAFSVETVTMLKNGYMGAAMLYIIISVLGGLLATFAGMLISKLITST